MDGAHREGRPKLSLVPSRRASETPAIGPESVPLPRQSRPRSPGWIARHWTRVRKTSKPPEMPPVRSPFPSGSPRCSARSSWIMDTSAPESTSITVVTAPDGPASFTASSGRWVRNGPMRTSLNLNERCSATGDPSYTVRFSSTGTCRTKGTLSGGRCACFIAPLRVSAFPTIFIL